MSLGPTELIVILVIVLLLFGSTKLPKLARSLGQAQKEFKKGTDQDDLDDDDEIVEPAPKRVVKRSQSKRARTEPEA